MTYYNFKDSDIIFVEVNKDMDIDEIRQVQDLLQQCFPKNKLLIAREGQITNLKVFSKENQITTYGYSTLSSAIDTAAIANYNSTNTTEMSSSCEAINTIDDNQIFVLT